MDDKIKYTDQPRRGKAIAGVILLMIGGLLLLQQLDFHLFSYHIVLWPLWLIGWGAYAGARHNFRNSSAFVLILLGVVFLVQENSGAGGDFIWPVAMIVFGLWIILRRNDKWNGRNGKDYVKDKWWVNTPYSGETEPKVDYTTTDVPPVDNASSSYKPGAESYLDAVSIFGGVKKTILSKDFKGGEIVNVFGGAELDFSQANINGHVVIDITQIFGGTKIIVPGHWHVVPDMAAVFASVDDKRIKTAAPPDSNKVLVIKGVSIFAGVDVRSY